MKYSEKTKKIGKWINRGIKCLVVMIVWNFLWHAILSDIIPWTRTWFSSHQAYINLLKEERSFGGVYFIQEEDAGFGEAKYYIHQQLRQKQAAYSVKLGNEKYIDIVESRINYYREMRQDDKDSIVYMLQEDARYNIEGSEWYEENLLYVDKVLQNPKAQRDYYFLIVIRINTASGTCYNGIILNDTTQELVEFSVELPDAEPIREENTELGDFLHSKDMVLVFIVLGGAFLLVHVMKVIDKKLDKKS